MIRLSLKTKDIFRFNLITNLFHRLFTLCKTYTSCSVFLYVPLYIPHGIISIHIPVTQLSQANPLKQHNMGMSYLFIIIICANGD